MIFDWTGGFVAFPLIWDWNTGYYIPVSPVGAFDSNADLIIDWGTYCNQVYLGSGIRTWVTAPPSVSGSFISDAQAGATFDGTAITGLMRSFGVNAIATLTLLGAEVTQGTFAINAKAAAAFTASGVSPASGSFVANPQATASFAAVASTVLYGSFSASAQATSFFSGEETAAFISRGVATASFTPEVKNQSAFVCNANSGGIFLPVMLAGVTTNFISSS